MTSTDLETFTVDCYLDELHQRCNVINKQWINEINDSNEFNDQLIAKLTGQENLLKEKYDKQEKQIATLKSELKELNAEVASNTKLLIVKQEAETEFANEIKSKSLKIVSRINRTCKNFNFKFNLKKKDGGWQTKISRGDNYVVMNADNYDRFEEIIPRPDKFKEIAKLLESTQDILTFLEVCFRYFQNQKHTATS